MKLKMFFCLVLLLITFTGQANPYDPLGLYDRNSFGFYQVENPLLESFNEHPVLIGLVDRQTDYTYKMLNNGLFNRKIEKVPYGLYYHFLSSLQENYNDHPDREEWGETLPSIIYYFIDTKQATTIELFPELQLGIGFDYQIIFFLPTQYSFGGSQQINQNIDFKISLLRTIEFYQLLVTVPVSISQKSIDNDLSSYPFLSTSSSYLTVMKNGFGVETDHQLKPLKDFTLKFPLSAGIYFISEGMAPNINYFYFPFKHGGSAEYEFMDLTIQGGYNLFLHTYFSDKNDTIINLWFEVNGGVKFVYDAVEHFWGLSMVLTTFDTYSRSPRVISNNFLLNSFERINYAYDMYVEEQIRQFPRNNIIIKVNYGLTHQLYKHYYGQLMVDFGLNIDHRALLEWNNLYIVNRTRPLSFTDITIFYRIYFFKEKDFDEIEI